MTVPCSGTLHLSKIEKEQQHDDYNSSAATASNISLSNLSRGQGYDTINTENFASNRPDGSAPHAMSEYYCYTQDLTAYVRSDSASSVVSGGARLNGTVLNNTGGLFEKGFVWSQTDSTPTDGESGVVTTPNSESYPISTGAFYYDLTNRPASTQFWYRAYIQLSDGSDYRYGAVQTFTTSSSLTSFNHSNGVMKIVMLCGYASYGNTSYHDGSGSYPGVGDICYSNSSGSSYLAANRYKTGGGSWFLVGSNGAITSVGIC